MYLGTRCLASTFKNSLNLEWGLQNGLNKIYKIHFGKTFFKIGQIFVRVLKIDSINQILDSPLWYNENLLNGIDFCIRDWHDKGIVLVSDITDGEGNIYQFEALKTKYNLRGTYLDFQAFIRRIPEVWKNEINYILD